jgi:hypothetical protein
MVTETSSHHRGQVVGFYKEGGKTKPITKPVAQLKRKKIVKDGKHFHGVHPKMQMIVSVPRNVDVTIKRKVHNPAEIELKGLTHPTTGEPLEPAKGYGSSIMYAPYSGQYVMVSVPEAREAAKRGGGNSAPYVVKPRFTDIEEGYLKIAKSKLRRAANIVEEDKGFDGLERAFRILEPVQLKPQMTQVYPHITEDPVFREVRDATQYVLNMLRSSGGEKEGDKFVQRGREQLLASAEAIAG